MVDVQMKPSGGSFTYSAKELSHSRRLMTNAEQMKEPRGFLKAIEALVSLAALGCIAGFKLGDFQYPTSMDMHAAQFFVFTASASFLYSVVALVVYIIVGKERLPNWAFLTDFVVSVSLCIVWLMASTIVTARAYGHVTSPDAVNPANIVAGIIFGYSMSILYGVNSWYCFIETTKGLEFMESKICKGTPSKLAPPSTTQSHYTPDPTNNHRGAIGEAIFDENRGDDNYYPPGAGGASNLNVEVP